MSPFDAASHLRALVLSAARSLAALLLLLFSSHLHTPLPRIHFELAIPLLLLSVRPPAERRDGVEAPLAAARRQTRAAAAHQQTLYVHSTTRSERSQYLSQTDRALCLLRLKLTQMRGDYFRF